MYLSICISQDTRGCVSYADNNLLVKQITEGVETAKFSLKANFAAGCPIRIGDVVRGVGGGGGSN